MGRVGASGRLQRRPLSDPGPPRPLVHQAHQRRFVGLLVERRSEGSSTEAERDRASLRSQRLTVHRHIFTTESVAGEPTDPLYTDTYSLLWRANGSLSTGTYSPLRASLESQRLTVQRHIFTTESAAVKAAVKAVDDDDDELMLNVLRCQLTY